MVQLLPKGYRARNLRLDASAAVAVTFMSIPQGVAYSLVAGLPPAMGLYAAALPAIVGSLFRSSRHVITGPTNAISLLVAATVAAQAGVDPVSIGIVLALLVGLMQLGAGVLRLGTIVDYISTPVVLGYISGAAVLIGVGQLRNLTGTSAVDTLPGWLHGTLPERVYAWVTGLQSWQPVAVVVGLAVAAAIVVLRRRWPRFPGTIAALATATLVTWILDLPIQRISDLAPVPAGLPPLTLPWIDTATALALIPAAIAASVLSLVESSSVARTITAKSGQSLNLSREFVGQGLANLAAAFTGAYPTSGSLSRSALNYQVGARSPLAGALSGVLMIVTLLVLGPFVDPAPIAALAGVLLVVSVDLVDIPRIRHAVGGRWGDGLAYAGTLIGTWMLPLDKAIYVGVGISLVMFLRRVKHLVVREIVVAEDGRLREIEMGAPAPGRCKAVRIVHVEGQLFFAAANELENALADMTHQDARVIVVRLKRTQGLDATAAEMLGSVGARMRAEGRHLFLVGMREGTMDVLRNVGVEDELGADHLFPTRRRWFAALDEAIAVAIAVAGDHGSCPLADYVERRMAVGPPRHAV